MSNQEMGFYCAAIIGNINKVDRILHGGQVDVATQSFAGHTILHGACSINKPGVVKALLEKSKIRESLVNVRDHRHGRTPLQATIVTGNTSLALTLLKAGSDPNIQDNDGRSALHLACCCNSDLTLTSALLSLTPADEMSRSDQSGKSCWHYAAEHGNVGLVHMLLECTPYPQFHTWHWDMTTVPVEEDSRHLYGMLIRLLLDAGTEIIPKFCEKRVHLVHRQLYCLWRRLCFDPDQRLRTAAAQGNTSVIQRLLRTSQGSFHRKVSSPQHWWSLSGVDVPSPVTDWTPLMIASRYGQVSAVVLLMEAGANPWQTTEMEDRCALQLAQEYGHFGVVQEILRQQVCRRCDGRLSSYILL